MTLTKRKVIRMPLLFWTPADGRWRCAVCGQERETQHRWDECARESARRANELNKQVQCLEKLAAELLERVLRYARKEKSA